MNSHSLPEHLNDNKIINTLAALQNEHRARDIILVSKDINMRLKARGFGVEAQDYHNDQLLDDIDLLPKGYREFPNSFWDTIEKVETIQREGMTEHIRRREGELARLNINEFVIDQQGFVGKVSDLSEDQIVIRDLHQHDLMNEEVWGLVPRDIYQALALNLLLDPDVHLVNLTGSAGSGKTILALAARMVPSCNVWHLMGGLPILAVQSILFLIGLIPGAWLGSLILSRVILNGPLGFQETNHE